MLCIQWLSNILKWEVQNHLAGVARFVPGHATVGNSFMPAANCGSAADEFVVCYTGFEYAF
jgi:hypothetical protein